MRRRGMALFVVLALAVLLLLVVSGLFQQGQDAVAQAVRAEGRLALINHLKNASAEAWWLVMNPGRYPPPPRPADREPVALYRALRTAGAAEGGPAVSLALAVTGSPSATRLPSGGKLSVTEVTARGRDRRVKDGIPQGLIQVRATGEFRADRVVVRLAVVQLRAYWLAGNAEAPRMDLGDELVAQTVEELP